METGKIKWFGNKGFGFIITEEKEELFFHINASISLKGKESSLVEGESVIFERRPSQRKKGSFEAYNVSLEESRSDPQPLSTDTEPEASHFHNPYTFIPTPPRGHITSDQFPGDYDPLARGLTHEDLKSELWTGCIPIELTTVTPLLLLDVGEQERDTTKHQTYEILDYLPETSLRGMLRSAYEISTNSRYACFRNSEQLAYRMQTQEALPLIPVMIERGHGSEELMARLYPGTSLPTAEGPRGTKPEHSAMYAAMLTLYGKSVLRSGCSLDPSTGKAYEPKTGDEVWAEVVLCQHKSWNNHDHRWQTYNFWKVIQVWPKEAYLTQPSPTGKKLWPDPRPDHDKSNSYAPLDPKHPHPQIISGVVLITNENINNKHDERIFFSPANQTFDVTQLQSSWKLRIQSYRHAHSTDDIFNRPQSGSGKAKPWEKIGRNSGETAWSPPLYQNGNQTDRWHRPVHDALDLQPNDLVYARCAFNKQGKIEAITDLFPVMISRDLYDSSPEELLHCTLQPATKRSQLSPADRLFGWVPQEGSKDTAYKSRIRMVCEEGSRPDIVRDFDGDTVSLTILGQPKPAQGRFYVAKDSDGAPPDRGGRKKDKGYHRPHALRGRKQYWHHVGLEAEVAPDYWTPAIKDRSPQQYNGRYQEYMRHPKEDGTPQTDSQNRSVTGWIKPTTVFHASLYVQNLEPEEVGALLWLLSLPDDHYFRLGYGKPLGFGSVRLKLDQDRCADGRLPVGTGTDWKAYYSSFESQAPVELDKEKQKECIDAFRSCMANAYGLRSNVRKNDSAPAPDDNQPQRLSSFAELGSFQSGLTSVPSPSSNNEAFEDLPFIKGFLQVLRGPQDNAPIHYPRTSPRPDRKGENFRWFTRNEGRGGGLPLPAVTDNERLPY